MPDPTPLITLNAVQTLAFGFGLGALGQGARAIVGLKKTHDEAAAASESFSSHFNASELVVSLIIGGIAGTFATIPLLAQSVTIQKDSIMMLIAAGYAGADFIEGFITRSLSPANPPTPAATKPAATTPEAGVPTPEAVLTPPPPPRVITPEANPK